MPTLVLVRCLGTLPPASPISYLANLKPAALPGYTHMSSERKLTSALQGCWWGQFHHHCCYCISGTPLSCTSQWLTIGWLNGSRSRKPPETCEEKRSQLSPSYQKGSVAVTLQNTQPQMSFDLGLTVDRGNTTTGRFVPKLARLPFLWEKLPTFFSEYQIQLFMLGSIKFLVK